MSKVVKKVFDKVANNYDFMNDLMSFGLHRSWKKTFIKMLEPHPEHKLLDLAGGTGDIAMGFLDAGGGSAILSDINEKMLEAGNKERLDKGLFNKYKDKLQSLIANAEELPFADATFDRVTISFGIRNVSSVDKVLSESFRVLTKGGKFFCMEFVRPEATGLRRDLYDLYSYKILPLLGRVIVGDPAPYQYLADSIRAFLPSKILLEKMKETGFQLIKEKVLIKDLVAIYYCDK
jgi:demethylmenaquinone methyltransferase/2-methoxy-6-polyprenyl-1,4-benzoquinol methylase